LKIRTEDYREVAQLQDQIFRKEAANPVAGLRWRQQQLVRSLLETALFSEGEALQTRIKAVQKLCYMACPPVVASGSEEALHKILQEVQGEGKAEVQKATESALRHCWQRSGAEDVDKELQRAIALRQNNLTEAIKVFTDLIEIAPEFAEVWSNRAIAFYLLNDFNNSVKDCNQVLKLKPKHFVCLSNLGTAHIQQGSVLEAVKWLKAALEVHPGLSGTQKLADDIQMGEQVTPQLLWRVFARSLNVGA